MTSFDFDIPEKDLAAALFMTKLNHQLMNDMARQQRSQRLTKSEVARLLGIDKAAVSRMLRGNSNLTERTIGELLWAMNVEWDIVSRDLAPVGSNHKSGPAAQVTAPATAAAGHVVVARDVQAHGSPLPAPTPGITILHVGMATE